MFVSIACDFSTDDHREEVYKLFKLYGLKSVLPNVYESVSITENMLSRLKHDIDKVTDYYDKIVFYQFPVNGTMAITNLDKKKWKRIILKNE